MVGREAYIPLLVLLPYPGGIYGGILPPSLGYKAGFSLFSPLPRVLGGWFSSFLLFLRVLGGWFSLFSLPFTVLGGWCSLFSFLLRSWEAVLAPFLFFFSFWEGGFGLFFPPNLAQQ